MTALDIAVQNNNEELISMLLKYDAKQSKVPDIINVRPIDLSKTKYVTEFLHQYE